MKILFHNYAFIGGAPKSLLEYAKLAKKNNIETVSIGKKSPTNTITDEYKDNGIKTIHLENFQIKNVFKNFILLIKYHNKISNIKPDLIHTITLENIYYNYLVSKLTNIPIIYTIPGGDISPYAATIIDNILDKEIVIVFSEENKQALLNMGNEQLDIRVITNRMSFKYEVNKLHDYTVEEKINLLLISRISKNKKESIIYAIKCTTYLASQNIPVNLTIAGDGPLFNELVDKATNLNKKHNKKIINVIGYVSDIPSLVQQSHIVFGKGRSVLNGIIENRLSVVVNENSKMYLCEENNLTSLSNYNMTGRNEHELDEFTMKDLKKLCTDILNNEINMDTLLRIKNKMEEKYDIQYSETDILNIYMKQTNHNTKKVEYQPSLFKVLFEYIKLHLVYLDSKIKLKFKK